MNAKSSLFLMLAAGAAVSTAAMAGGNDPFAINAMPKSEIKGIRHAWVDMTTGEWSFDQAPSTRDGDFSVYNADSTYNVLGGFTLTDDATRTSTSINKFGTEMLSWGDSEFNMTVDQVVIAYGTNVPDDATPGVTGFDAVIRVYDNESGTADPTFDQIVTLTIGGIPGSTFTSGFAGWFVTADLGSANAFELGDTDGSDFYGNPGLAVAADEDEDGKADIGWSYAFNQAQATKGGAGPFIGFGGNMGGWYDADGDGLIDKQGGVDYPLDSAGTSSHLWNWFNVAPHASNIGNFRFTGSPPPGAVFNIEFRGPIPGDSVLDLNGDGAFDSGDFFNFLGRFDVAGG